METVATVCGYCGVGCGMDLHVADGVVTKATGRPDHPANRGRLCTKGTTTAIMRDRTTAFSLFRAVSTRT
jgi:anaerobic selenocysteine-containing dehydrogenase